MIKDNKVDKDESHSRGSHLIFKKCLASICTVLFCEISIFVDRLLLDNDLLIIQ